MRKLLLLALVALTHLICFPAVAGQVSINGSVACSSLDGGLTVDPAGNVTISCTGGTGAGSVGTPTCAPTASPSSIAGSSIISSTVTVSANCSGNPTSYQWGNASNSPSITPNGNGATGSTVFGPGTPAGTYTFYVTASNAAGTGAQATLTYTVQPQGSIVGGGGCPIAGSFTYTGQFKDFSIPHGTTASFQLPALTESGRHAEMIAFQSTQTPSDLQSELAVSSTCGSFDVPAECKQSGSSWSSIDLYSFSSNMGYCTLTPGHTYYVNVRNVVNGVDSCKQDSCAQRVQYIGDLR